MRKHHRAFRDGVEVHRQAEISKIFEKAGGEQRLVIGVLQSGQEAQVILGKAEFRQPFQHGAQPCGDGIAAAEREGAEEQVKRGVLLALGGPVAGGHGELIEIREERRMVNHKSKTKPWRASWR